MTILREDLKQLEQRVARLEETMQKFIPPQATHNHIAAVPETSSLTQIQVVAWLRSRGLIREPTAEEVRLAAEWEALPEATKQEHIDFMQHLRLEPTLSEIILENRR